MNALVGQEAPFDRVRQQMKLLADREAATKTVERTAEVIKDDIARSRHIMPLILRPSRSTILGIPLPASRCRLAAVRKALTMN